MDQQSRRLAVLTTLCLCCTPADNVRRGQVWSNAAPCADARAPAPSPSAVVFPVRVDAGKRNLVDAAGKPFFVNGDTP